MTHVNIVTSDRGWILEKLAREIADRLPYVTFGEGPDPGAGIQYYVTYSCRHRRLSPVEVAYFAHLEPEGEARARFFDTAREVEHCVCHARLYEAVLRETGVEQVTTISPGVDAATFRPKLRIGVVGRTYHTGRKGEALVAQVMDIPEIEWSFTGEGWPGPALDLPAAALPDYYRGLDYVLVPALYEGGPMCVVEALACGTEVIAPAIGWVPEFPHVEYQAGDAADLRRVLLGLVEKKRALRAAVLDRSWDAWAEGHDRLFRGLAGAHGLDLAPPGPRAPRLARPRRVGVFLHGNEHRSQGGPTVRVPRLARELRENGTEAELRIHPAPDGFEGLDLVHAFNGWSPWSALDLLRRARGAGKAVVFSPIFLDLTARDIWEDRLAAAFAEAAPGAAAEAALAPVIAALRRRQSGAEPPHEAAPGFHAAVREMAEHADRLILLSEREGERLARIGARVDHGVVVRNPVDATLFGAADPALFKAETGLSDFVLCVARIEPRKNQLLLAHALRDLDIPLVLLGHTANPAYRDLVERHGGPNLRILDRLPPNSPLLASAFAAARVAVLPSWAEGAPLAALEAAAAGASLVLSDESGEREYFGDLARYVDPADPAAIRRTILDAFETRRDASEIAAQKAFIAGTYSWDRHRAATEAVQAEALAAARARPAARPQAPAVAPQWRQLPIVYDVTTSANHSGRWTGIARVEAALAIALKQDPRADIRFVAWNNKAREFIEVPFEGIRAGKLARLLAHHDAAPVPLLHLPEGAHYVVPGSGWMQNQVYAESTVAFARRHRLRLTPIIHDIIPTRFPFWFNDGYAPVFEQNLQMLLDGADHVAAISQATKRDVEAYAARIQGLFIPGVSVFREGDEIQLLSEEGDAAALARLEQDFARRPFVLTVGAIHQRKNHKLLYDVWLKLAETMGPRCPHLVIVGGVAWNGHEVARALRGDPRLRDKVSILDNVDDLGLDWLYRNCLFTVYPSLYEGWGLPVAESLKYGKPCIAADTSSVPEIAPGLVELVDPLDVAAWATKIRFLAGSRSARAAMEARIAAEHRGFTWARSAEALLDLLAAAEAAPRAKRPYTLGQVVPFADRVAAARIRGAGWHPFEKWGCWASASRAELLFEPGLAVREPLALIVEARALTFPNTPFEVRVLANDMPVARWRLRGGELQVLHAVIPAAIAARGPAMRITFESAFLTPVRQVTKSEDGRLVGLGLARVALAPLAGVADAGRYFSAQARGGPRPELGRMHNLMADAEARGVLAGRWNLVAGWGMTSAELRPRLELPLQEMPGRDLDVELRLRPVATPAAPLLLLALANGEEVGAWTFRSDEPVSVRFALPGAVRARAEPVTLDLVPADSRAPQPLGLGAAEEAFGFGLIAYGLRLAGQPEARPRLPLAAGEPLLLAAGRATGGDALLRAALGPEWHAPERNATWSFGAAATLPLRLDAPPAEGVLIRATVEGFQPPAGAAAIALEILAAGQVLARHALTPRQPRNLEVAVPRALIGPGGELDLAFRVPVAPSPRALGQGTDERPLGIRLARLDLAAPPLLAAGRVLRFGLDPASGSSAALPFLRGDWFAPEASGCWTQDERGALAFAPDPALGGRWRLFLLARPLGATPAAPAQVEVELDGQILDRWAFVSDTPAILEARDLAARLAGASLATLALRRPGAVAPAELGLGADGRRLGVMVIAAVLLGEAGDEAAAREAFAAAGLGRHRAAPETAPPVPTPAEPPPRPAPPPPMPAPPKLAPATPTEPPPTPVQSLLLDLSQGGALYGARLAGWFEAEPEGRWSEAERGEIRLPPAPEGAGRLALELVGRVFGTGVTGPAEVEIGIEGGGTRALNFASDDFQRHELELDCAAPPDGTAGVALRLRRLGAVSPAEAGQGDDERRLGLLLRTLAVVWR